jgi:hypothetical protein
MKNATPQQIDILQQEIVKNQNEFYNSIELSFKPFVKFLDKHKIDRV